MAICFKLQAGCLFLSDVRTNELKLELPLNHSRFTIEFIHSVLGTKIRDEYEINQQNGEISLVAEYFSGYAYGLSNDTPSNNESLVHLQGEDWVIFTHRIIADLVIIPIQSQATTLITYDDYLPLAQIHHHSLLFKYAPCTK